MRSSLLLAVTGAALAMAGPVQNIDKRALETDWVVEMVTITVTAGQEPPKPTAAVFVEEAPAAAAPAAPEQPEPEAPKPEAPKPEFEVPKVQQPPPKPKKQKKPAPPKPKPAPEPVVEKPSGGDYADTMLYQHNIHRMNHSAPAMQWDEELAQYAENIANGCVFEHDMDQGNGGYGQNLASWGTSGSMAGAQMDAAARGVTNQWYNGEMMNWDYYGMSDPPAGADLHAWGHFTQVVWKASTKLGCATVQCPAGTVLGGVPAWYTVCNYGPAGNMGTQYGKNVLPPQNQRVAVA